MGNRRLELDNALAEKKPLLLVWKGKEYNLPGAIPAKAVLEYLPHLSEDGGIPQDKLGDFLSDLISKENYKELLEDGISWPDLNRVVEWAVREYGLLPDTENEEAKVSSVDPT